MGEAGKRKKIVKSPKTLWGRLARSQGSRLVQRSCSPGLKHDDDDDDGDDDGDCGNDDDDDDFLPQTVV